MFLHFREKINRFKRPQNDSGGTMLEYAIVTPIFFLLLIGLFEVSLIVLVQTSLETAVLQVTRFGRTGDLEPGQNRLDTAKAIAVEYSFGLIDPSKLQLTVTSYESFGDIPVLSMSPTDEVIDWGSGGQPVVYTLSYDWPFFTTLISDFFQNSDLKIKASAVIRNEPFEDG